VDGYRQQFEPKFGVYAGTFASADTSLKRSLKLSLFPNAGVVLNAAATASLTVETPPASDLTISLRAPNGNAKFPDSVKIPAGARTVSFTYTGVSQGVEELQAIPSDSAYETAFARVQVAGASLLKLAAVSGDRQSVTPAGALADPVVVRLADANNLVYAGVRIVAAASAGGSASPTQVVTDARGQASFAWTPGGAATSQLTLTAEGFPGVSLTVNAGSTVPVATAVVNAASFASGMAAGAIETIAGFHLAGGRTVTATYPWPPTLSGVQVQLNGTALPLLYVSDSQINFYVPQETPLGAGTLTVTAPGSAPATSPVKVVALDPGIFPAAVVRAGTTINAAATPVHAGDYLEIYCTGLGPTHDVAGLQRTLATPTVFIGAVPLTPIYSGLAPGYVGLYQVDVQVPAGLPAGPLPLVMAITPVRSNEVTILVE
jgi:uncharacterized protein (TIGR03437 family)